MTDVRAFIAIPLSNEVHQRLEEISSQLKKKLGDKIVRWVSPRNIHLTLKFLGDVPVSSLGNLNEIITNEAGRMAAFELQVGGLGAFPSIQRPRVIWVGVQAPAQLTELQQHIDLETAKIGYASEGRPFSPHLTLGRVNRDGTPDELRRIGPAIAGVKVENFSGCAVDTVNLYKSDLKPGGSVYTTLYTAKLTNRINP